MAYGDTPHDALLRSAWEDFCDRLKGAGDLVFRDSVPATALARAEGFQFLSRFISFSLDAVLEHNDPLFPQLWRFETPTNKFGGDNPDGNSLRARIDGEHTFRVVGNMGNADYLVFTVYRGDTPGSGDGKIDATPSPSPEMAHLYGHELRTEWDGSFELIMSPQQHSGNWLQTGPGAQRFSIRQFFGDWERAKPMVARIERVGAEGAPAPLTPERVAKALDGAAQHLLAETTFWADWFDNYMDTPNEFVGRRGRNRGGAPGKQQLNCYWKVQPDEALIVEVTPPKALWWSYELNNYWMNSLDYRYHLSSLNHAQAVREDDGLVRLAIAHEDPGVANWLETGGHCEGRVELRWILAESAPVPRVDLVKLADLPTLLPQGAKRVTPAERRDQLRAAKIGVDRRYRV